MKFKILCGIIIVSLSMVFMDSLYAETEVSGRHIDPDAEKYIRELSVRRKEIKSCTFKVFDTMDIVQDNGQKLQFSHIRTVAMSYPDKLHVVTTGDLANRSIWKNSRTFTMLDRDKNVYARIEAHGTIEDVMDRLLEFYGTRMPLADIISKDIYSVLTKKALSIQYVGLHYAGGIECHHLAGIQENIDWQVWIKSGDDPCLQKVVITYKKKTGQPQYSMFLQERKVLSSLSDNVFEFDPPAGVEQIKFLPVFNQFKDKSLTHQGGN